ncbi:hypothetical protein [Rhizobium cremeum]|uniref:hypothetical protein n=1 Tax=Rhizobium cremeum TaxID=2813827 RepID=UPI0013B00AFD
MPGRTGISLQMRFDTYHVFVRRRKALSLSGLNFGRCIMISPERNQYATAALDIGGGACPSGIRKTRKDEGQGSL